MKREEAQSIGDILRLTLQECNMTSKLDERKAIDAWCNLLGPMARRCGRPTVKNGIMTVYTYSAPLRQELNMSRTRLIGHINEMLGKTVITDIRFIG